MDLEGKRRRVEAEKNVALNVYFVGWNINLMPPAVPSVRTVQINVWRKLKFKLKLSLLDLHRNIQIESAADSIATSDRNSRVTELKFLIVQIFSSSNKCEWNSLHNFSFCAYIHCRVKEDIDEKWKWYVRNFVWAENEAERRRWLSCVVASCIISLHHGALRALIRQETFNYEDWRRRHVITPTSSGEKILSERCRNDKRVCDDYECR